MAFTWSHPEQIATVNSGDTINFNIFVEEDPIFPATEPTRVTDLQFEDVGTDPLPATVSVINNNDSISVSGSIDASAIFVRLAYEEDAKEIKVDLLQDIPDGANVVTMVPDNTVYKYYMFRIFAEDEFGEEIVSRTFTITVIVSWDKAKNTIKQYVENINASNS